MENQDTTLFDDVEQLESIVVPPVDVPLGAAQAALVDPKTLTDTFFLAKKERLQLYRQPIFMRQVVKGEVISIQKQRDPFQFVGGRYPGAGDRITHAIAAELRKHALFNNRFLEYQPRSIPERTESRHAVENERLRQQVAAMETRQNEMARRLEEAYARQVATKEVHASGHSDEAPQVTSPSLTKAVADQAIPAPSQPAPPQPAPSQPAPSQPAPPQPAPSQPAPPQPAPSQPAPSQPAPSQPARQASGRRAHMPPEQVPSLISAIPASVPTPPAGIPDGTILDASSGQPQKSEIPITPPTVIPSISNKLDAIEAMTGNPLNLPVEDLGTNPTKGEILTFAHRHNVSFPGYE